MAFGRIARESRELSFVGFYMVVPTIGVREFLDLGNSRNSLEACNICLGRTVTGILSVDPLT